MTTFDDVTARRTVMNLCVEGGMTPIQTLKQMQSTDIYIYIRRYLNSLYKLRGKFSNGWTDSSIIVDDRHARIKSKLWSSRTSLKAIVGRECAKELLVPVAASLLLSAF